MCRGYVLKGRVITEAIKAQSVQSVLEDANGVVVTVSPMYAVITALLQQHRMQPWPFAKTTVAAYGFRALQLSQSRLPACLLRCGV